MILTDRRGLAGPHPRAAVLPPLLTLGTVLLVAAVVRVWGLAAKSFWYDEAYSLFLAGRPVREILALVRGYDLHPPLYYVVMHVWVRLVGTGEVAVRLSSVLASVGAVGVTFLLARRLAGELVGVLAAALLAFSPFQLTAAQEARMYPLLTLLAVGATFMLFLALEEGRWHRWAAYSVLLILSLYTHHLAFLVLLGHGIYVVGVERRGPATRAWLLCAAAVFLAYLPYLPTLAEQFARARGWLSFQAPFRVGLLPDVVGLLAFGGRLWGMGTYYGRGTLPLVYRVLLVLPFLVVAVCGAAALRGRRARGVVLAYVLVPLVVTALLAGRWNLLQERYFSFVLPGFDILTAAGLVYLAGRSRPPHRTAVLIGLVGAMALVTVPSLAGAYREQPLYDWRGAAQYVTAQAAPEDFVHFVPAFVSIPFDVYFRGAQPRLPLNPAEVLENALLVTQQRLPLRTSVVPDRMRAIARGHPRMWMIASVALGPTIHEKIGRAVEPFFRRVETRTFGLVQVSLWESRLYGEAGRP